MAVKWGVVGVVLAMDVNCGVVEVALAMAVNWGVVEVVLAIWDSLQTSFTKGWWCRARALALKVKSKAKLNYFSSTATELGVVVTSTNYY